MDQLEGTVLLHVQTAAMAVDEHGRIGVFNPAAARVLGVPVASVPGHDLDDFTRSEPGLAALAGVLEARRTGVAEARRQVTVDTPSGERTLGCPGKGCCWKVTCGGAPCSTTICRTCMASRSRRA